MDNTFGTTASVDWNPLDRLFEKASGSEGWEFSELAFDANVLSGITLKLDYFDRKGDSPNPNGAYIQELSIVGIGDKLIDKGVIDTNLSPDQKGFLENLFEFDTSLAYNYRNASKYFGTRTADCGPIGGKDEQICSPVNSTNNPDPTHADALVDEEGEYHFNFELVNDEEWIPEVIYEYSIDLVKLSSLLAPLSAVQTIVDEFDESDIEHYAVKSGIIHLSPHKLNGGNKLFTTDYPCEIGNPNNDPLCGDTPPPSNEVPEPATLAIFGLGLAGLGVMRRRRRLGLAFSK